MAHIVGREMLIADLEKSSGIKLKGDQGELAFLEKFGHLLKQDDYLIHNPNFGELNPDFLHISPAKGFYIFEVKNVVLSTLVDVDTAGNFYAC